MKTTEELKALLYKNETVADAAPDALQAAQDFCEGYKTFLDNAKTEREAVRTSEKLLLDAGGFGPAARLQGIYHTAFSDQADIPDGLLGYAALAQGLGMVRGDGSGRLNPNRTATRGEAAVMLYAFMGRAS